MLMKFERPTLWKQCALGQARTNKSLKPTAACTNRWNGYEEATDTVAIDATVAAVA